MIRYGLLTADDEMASEYEVYDLLYALVRLLKPKVILETGTYKGGATKAMAKAAKENGMGFLWTCDTDAKKLTEAAEFAGVVNSDGIWWGADLCTGLELCSKAENVDLAFIDSSGDRVAEVAALNLAPGGVVVLHDSKRPQYEPIKLLRPWKAIWEVDTIQGLAIFQS